MKQKRKNPQTMISSFLPRILSMGPLDLMYIIHFTEDELEHFKLDMNTLNSINQLTFLKRNQAIWNTIQLLTNNSMINLLLYINKTNEQKSYIDYLAYQLPQYSKEESEFSEMLTTINEFHFLFINDQSLYIPSEFSISLMIMGGGQIKKFKIGTPATKDMAQDQRVDDNQKQQSKKNDKTIKVSNTESTFNQIKLKCLQYEYFIVDIDDAIYIKPIDTFIEFISYMKIEYNSNIIIRYRNVNKQFTTHEEMICLNKIYLLTDTFILDFKDATCLFDQHYQSFTTNKKQKIVIDEQNLLHYFSSTITCGGALSLCNSKLGLFIDDFNRKVEMVEIPNSGQVTRFSYDYKPYPKINHINIDLIHQYKTILNQNNDELKSIFFGGFLGRLCFNRKKIKGIETLYPSYLAGIEIVKRILELKVNNLPYPIVPEFYLVKLTQTKIDSEVKKNHLAKKEDKFVLDCTNIKKSKMKYYVPLFDYNLHEYFSSDYVQKELLNKGFINSKGFVNYDPIPLYRNVMKPKIKRQRAKSSKKNQSEIVYNKYVEATKEHKHRILRSVPPTVKKLPNEQCEVMDKLKIIPICKHKDLKNSNKKCIDILYNLIIGLYCYLSEREIILEEKEIERRKMMKLRKYE